MIGQLWNYFGVIGLASIAFWLATLIVLAIFSRHPRRNIRYLQALGVAVVAFALAQVNSRRVSAFEVDRTEELEAARQAQQEAQAAAEAPASPGARLRFAEDAPGEAAQVAEGTDASAATETNQAAPEAAGPTEPAYRRAGKQEREAGKIQPIGEGVEPLGIDEERPVRRMKEAEVIRANHYDRLNLLAVRFTLGLAILLVALDYLARLNRTFERYFPLPIAGRWVDALFPRAHRVAVQTPPAHLLPQYLETVVRRGETFLYLGGRDPWPERAALPRLDLKGRALWSVPKFVASQPGVPGDTEFLLDAVWFGRAAVVITGAAAARRVLPDLVDLLQRRHQTRARTRRTLHLVWDLPEPPGDAALEELLLLAPEMNFRFLLVSPGRLSEEIRERFEEVHAAAA